MFDFIRFRILTAYMLLGICIEFSDVDWDKNEIQNAFKWGGSGFKCSGFFVWL